jgi:hypothetical protein
VAKRRNIDQKPRYRTLDKRHNMLPPPGLQDSFPGALWSRDAPGTKQSGSSRGLTAFRPGISPLLEALIGWFRSDCPRSLRGEDTPTEAGQLLAPHPFRVNPLAAGDVGH